MTQFSQQCYLVSDHHNSPFSLYAATAAIVILDPSLLTIVMKAARSGTAMSRGAVIVLEWSSDDDSLFPSLPHPTKN